MGPVGKFRDARRTAGNGSTGSGDCVRLVAQTIKLIDGSKFKSDCKLQLSDNAVTTATAPYFAK